jgi:hypothetical protein
LSDFDIINFLMISDVRRGAISEQRLNDLRERAADLATRTGQKPRSFHEFQKVAPKTPLHTFYNVLIGSGLGVGVGALWGYISPSVAVEAVVGCLITGGAIGAFAQTENDRRNELVRDYESYLDEFEISAKRGKSVASEPGNVKTTHAAQLLLEREAPQAGRHRS